MQLDDFIAALQAVRTEHGGDLTVVDEDDVQVFGVEYNDDDGSAHGDPVVVVTFG